jgi:hypothetical protein
MTDSDLNFFQKTPKLFFAASENGDCENEETSEVSQVTENQSGDSGEGGKKVEDGV